MDLKKEEKLLIEMIMRQTSYTYDESKEKLKQNNNDYMKVLKEYFGIKEKKSDNLTINQGIFKEIRSMMDTAGKRFRNNQEMQKLAQNYYKQQQKQDSKKLDMINEVSQEEDDNNFDNKNT